MAQRTFGTTPWLLAFGLLAFAVAGLSIADMFLPRPYDGVVPGKGQHLVIAGVIEGSSADLAGLKPGERIVGIGRQVVSSAGDASEILENRRIGERVTYLVKRNGGLEEVAVELGRRRVGDGTYFYICVLGFAFFFVGLFVWVRQPGMLTSKVFFLMSSLFLLFLVCGMRPLSYARGDALVLSIGTGAFLLLPAAFLHFYVLFPRPVWLRASEVAGRWRAIVWLFRRGWWLIYLLPALVFALAWLSYGFEGGSQQWILGAPPISWWLFVLFVLLGLAAVRANGRRIQSSRERRGVTLVFLGSLLGLAPFALLSLFQPDHQQSRAFLYLGIAPLMMVPITFTYAIVRFQLLDIRIIIRRSLLYGVTTALVTGLYALGIAMFNTLFRGSGLATSTWFPVLFALVIVLLFDPLRRRVQELIDSSFFAGRSALQGAMLELGEAITAQSDLQAVVRDLVDRLPQLLGFRFAALYIRRDRWLERMAGPSSLPERLELLPELARYLSRRKGLIRLDRLGALPLRSESVAELIEQLTAAGVEAVADLASRRRQIGVVLFSQRPGQSPLEKDELELLQRLLDQASLALETGLLIEERTQQAELEREIQIAANIQERLLPKELRFSEGWQVSAQCLPARIVGGDFFAQLPSNGRDNRSLIFGDVAGKSVSGALMMMAAHEVLYTLALAVKDINPSRLFDLANQRIYELGPRNFVALCYFGLTEDNSKLRYVVAGQPPPLLKRLDGTVEELPLAIHRVPIGALPMGGYRELELAMEPGEMVLGYSDGVTDARSPDGEFFGEERLREVVAAAETADAEELVSCVLQAVKDFVRGGQLYDDVTLVALTRLRQPDGESV